MSTSTLTSPSRRLLATVDTRDLNTLRWGPMRQLFPAFVEEIELGRFLKKLLATMQCCAVEIAPHRGSNHVFDVFEVSETAAKRRSD